MGNRLVSIPSSIQKNFAIKPIEAVSILMQRYNVQLNQTLKVESNGLNSFIIEQPIGLMSDISINKVFYHQNGK